MLTKDERAWLADVEARAAKATKGPWTVRSGHFAHFIQSGRQDLAGTTLDTSHVGMPNAQFMAAARFDVPALVALVRQLNGEAERIKAAVQDVIGGTCRACHEGAHPEWDCSPEKCGAWQIMDDLEAVVNRAPQEGTDA